MNVTEGFINQEDSGSVGYWALDNGVSSDALAGARRQLLH